MQVPDAPLEPTYTKRQIVAETIYEMVTDHEEKLEQLEDELADLQDCFAGKKHLLFDMRDNILVDYELQIDEAREVIKSIKARLEVMGYDV